MEYKSQKWLYYWKNLKNKQDRSQEQKPKYTQSNYRERKQLG